MREDTINLLKECNSGAKMGVESIDEILDKTETEDLKKILAISKVEHNEIIKRTGEILAKNCIETARPDAIATFMSKMKTEIKLMSGNADQKIAELMTDGCDMGIKSLTQYLNEYAAAEEPAKDLTGKLIKIEEHTREKLKAYL
ncbi:MAG: hypothetical protein IKE65_07180 [Clostridia bacterium]|nr:hypothetical protein [Clostridia bacterium]